MHSSERPSRRRFLQGIGVAGVAAGLAACVPPRAPRPTPVTASEAPTATGARTSPTPKPTDLATAEPTTTPAPSSDADALRRKIGRLLIVGFRGMRLRDGSELATALDDGLGGVILFDKDESTGGSRNISSPDQVKALTKALRAQATVPLLIAIDQEGGKVARLTPAYGFPPTRSQAAIGATDDPAKAEASGEGMGKTMSVAGIDLDLAPVVDLNVEPDNPAIGALDRSFSADPAVVSAMADAEIKGLHQHGVRAVLKHFPGLGSATANTDFDKVDVTDTWTRTELEPYQTLFGLGSPNAVMVAHIVNRKLDPDLPASLSPKIVGDLLRGELGWTGPVMSDSLGAVAITSIYKRQEAIALALEAGIDLLLFANQGTYVDDLARRVTDEVVELVASGRITEARLDESIARIASLTAG